MRSSFKQKLIPLWQTYSSPGQPTRATLEKALYVIYGLWFAAFALKLIGSSWDASWHFRYLRDDLAPPHTINAIGTTLVVMLVMFHTWTGYGVDRLSLRLMQAGIGIFLLAIPLDLLNHRLFGLDMTSWSPTHALLYLGTAVMLMGVIRGWLLLARPGLARTGLALAFGTFFLENILFPLCQQEYGVLSLAALNAGRPTADAELLAVAGANAAQFVVPVPAWVYPLWLVVAGGMVLLAARLVMGGRWTATTVAGTYLVYRSISYGLLSATGFPPSYIPFILLGTALAIDLAVMWRWRPVVGTLAVIGATYAGAWLTQQVTLMPPFHLATAPMAALLLWSVWASARWAQQSSTVARWTKLV